MAKLEDLREWLLDRIDGGEEMRGEDGLVSDFIRQIDAATAELADLKQRLLPQYIGRAERAQRGRRCCHYRRDHRWDGCCRAGWYAPRCRAADRVCLHLRFRDVDRGCRDHVVYDRHYGGL